MPQFRPNKTKRILKIMGEKKKKKKRTRYAKITSV